MADPHPPSRIVALPPLDDEIMMAADAALRLAAYRGAYRVWRGRRRHPGALPTFSPSVRQAVYEALHEASRDGLRWVGSEHLLVAVLSLPDSAAARFLTNWSQVDLDWLVGRLRDEPAYQGDSAPPLPSALAWLKFLRVLPATAPVPLRWPWRTAVWVLTRFVRRGYRRHGARYGHPMLAGCVSAAEQKAVELGRPYVTGAEVLLAVLDLHEQLTAAGSILPAEFARFSEAGEILRTGGVTLRAATKAATRLTTLPTDAEADLGQIPTRGWRTVRRRVAAPPYGRTSLAALRSASVAARDAGHSHAGTTHLLAAVLVEADGPAARLLHSLGADPAAIRAQAVARLATSSA
ncbi:Clp protease N-terminal domain-containing protein [Plantactinospora mayteni]|uniref:Clp protease N-terminal domain-containing protein n=1 Tax=Plantactinospora mayteni TaxID=566021 RepID=UPI0019439185|nr:Clp protease N-terminal domain-containing protein [Plantactinospora mayteni]